MAYGQAGNQYGHFDGTLKLQPVGDGVHMAVLEKYSYTDSDGDSLTAEPGFQTGVLWISSR